MSFSASGCMCMTEDEMLVEYVDDLDEIVDGEPEWKQQ